MVMLLSPSQFLSTPSARRATPFLARFRRWKADFYPRPPRGGRLAHRRHTTACYRYFYPRPPRGGRLTSAVAVNPALQISIHALREEGDVFPWSCSFLQVNFYPRPPRGGRHLSSRDFAAGKQISIHALREEGDSMRHASPRRSSDFYPRPPRGGRRTIFSHGVHGELFLSTPSARRATEGGAVPDESILEFLSTPSARRATEALMTARGQ